MSKTIEVLDMIIKDCEADVKEFEGKDLNGKNVASIHGILEAKIEALAKILKDVVLVLEGIEDELPRSE